MNILTFDIEEWFHILDNDSTKTPKKWKNYSSRIHYNMEKIFNLLDKNNQKATFFCLGWIGEKYPDIIKKISNKGYEIGSHGYSHQLVYELTPDNFKIELDKSIDILENITGKKVKIFRAPGFSITKNTKWAFEIMYELGIEIDCSVFPAHRNHGGIPSYDHPKPSIISYNNIKIKELPINYFKFLDFPIIFSGGGYFRLFPSNLIDYLINKSNYVMTYFHPRDFDPDQPMIEDLSLFRKFKSYIGLKYSENKLNKILKRHKFIDIKEASNIIDWDKVPTVNL